MKLTQEELDIINLNLHPKDRGYVEAVLNELDFINQLLSSKLIKNESFSILMLKNRKDNIESYLSNTLAIAKDRNQRKINTIYREMAKIKYF
jgi:hypothetical protein